ncbi:MAG: MAPEG family protein [Henriciella sp.]|nr:MAPEG family protein [Henriciella sp.]
MSELQTAAVYVAANILILVWLAFRVVQRRFKGRISIGDGGSEDLAVAIRIHGNATEYIPAGLIGLVLLALLAAPVWMIHAVGVTLTVARLLHPIGMSGGPILFRQLGILLSWIVLVSLAVALLYLAFS